MNIKIATVLTTFVRTQRFLDANAAALGQINQTGARKELDGAVTDLTGHVNTQESTRKQAMGETANQETLRNALLAQMRPIARIAASTLQSVPQFSSLKMPPATAGAVATLARAQAMADVAQQHLSTFTAAGLPADFLTQLGTAASAVQASLGTRDDLTGSRVVATQGTESASRRGRQAIKVLDAFIRRQLAGNDDLIAGWVSAKRYRAAAVVATSASTPAAGGASAVSGKASSVGAAATAHATGVVTSAAAATAATATAATAAA
jgi:hypothetical protein